MAFRLLVKKVTGIISLVTSSTNITTSAYVQLSASLANTVEAIQYYNGSTSTLVLAVGSAGNEVDKVLVGPGLSVVIPTEGIWPKGTRMSVKAIDATASSGVLAINLVAG